MNEAAHTSARELIGVHACDAVDDDERALVETHLSECAECSDEAARLREALAALVAATAVPAPEQVRELVLDQVRATRRPPGQAPAALTQRRRRTRTAWNRTAVAVITLMAAGLGTGTVGQQHRIDGQRTESAQAVELLTARDAVTRQVPVSESGTALVIESRQRDEVLLVYSNLPPLADGESYLLWLIGPNGSTRSVGVVSAASSSPVVINGIGRATELTMSVERSADESLPTGTTIMSVSIAG